MAHKYLYVHNRKRILKEIGLYNGETTTENKTESYKKAVLLLNKKYLPKQYHTELYYIASDNILRTIDNIKNAKSEHLDVYKRQDATSGRQVSERIELVHTYIGRNWYCTCFNTMERTGTLSTGTYLHWEELGLY